MKSQPMSHELFQYLYESVQTYSKQDLISMRDTISKYQERETQQASATNIPANKEMTVIRKLTLDKQQKSKDP
ncbi:TPA: hypothetical protein DEP21_03850 [Patescibacteria group bacterium]|nr:hypothetical protein [Candidatus Gracilibacteria bacterium]